MNATKCSVTRMYILCVCGRWWCVAGLQMWMYEDKQIYKQIYNVMKSIYTAYHNNSGAYYGDCMIHIYSSNLPIMVEYFHQCFYSV